METLGNILSTIGGIGSLVCFILVVVKMFQQGSTGLGIASILLLCCCVGGLLAYVYGWMKSREWNLTTVMIAWTVFIILNVIGGILAPVDYSQLQQQMGR